MGEVVRARSCERVRELGLPLNPALPHLDEPALRTEPQVVGRTLALHAVMAVLHGASRERVAAWVADEGLAPHVSPLEAVVLDGRGGPPGHQQVECLWALAWTLGMVPALDPRRPVDDGFVHVLPNLKTGEPADTFRARAFLRPAEELLAEADLHYLVGWAVRETALAGDAGPIVDGSALFQRRRALDWVIDRELDWDEVPLDT